MFSFRALADSAFNSVFCDEPWEASCLGLEADWGRKLWSRRRLDSSAKLKGDRPSLFVMLGFAPASTRYFTIRKCPWRAAMCRGVFFSCWVCSFISCPSLINMRTKSRSPSLHALHISIRSVMYKLTLETQLRLVILADVNSLFVLGVLCISEDVFVSFPLEQ